MSTASPIHTEGLGFKKLDLHLHTPGSKDFDDKSVTADSIVKQALAKGLDGIAVTDHNSGAWVNAVVAAARKTTLTVFPAVEITCMGGKEGIHIIALFETTCTTQDIESLLSELGFTPAQYGDIDAVVQKDPLTVAQVIARRRGLTILAHANSTKGVLNDMRGEDAR